MPAIQTYLPPLQHNSIEMRFSFFATRYRIDKVKRFILPQKNREYADVLRRVQWQRIDLRIAGLKSIYGYVSDNEYDLVYAYAERLSPRTRYTNTYI